MTGMDWYYAIMSLLICAVFLFGWLVRRVRLDLERGDTISDQNAERVDALRGCSQTDCGSFGSMDSTVGTAADAVVDCPCCSQPIRVNVSRKDQLG
jgi:hypothetical protein